MDEKGKIPAWSTQTYTSGSIEIWPEDNLGMTTADMLDAWRDLYEKIFPILLQDNLHRKEPKSPEDLAEETTEHVNEALKQYQLMEEKVTGMQTLADVEL